MQGNVIQVDNDLCTINFDYIEVNDKPAIIAHIDVHKWSKTTKPIILDIIDDLAKKQTLPIFVVHDGKDKKHLKWITMCNFVFTGHSTYSYGEEEYMYIWSKK